MICVTRVCVGSNEKAVLLQFRIKYLLFTVFLFSFQRKIVVNIMASNPRIILI